MSGILTVEYLEAHKTDNKEHYQEAGQLLSNAILDDAIAFIKINGNAERVVLTTKIEISANDEKGCITVTYTRGDGTTLSYHRPT